MRRSISDRRLPDDPLGGGPIPSDVLAELRRSAGGGVPLPVGVAAASGASLGADLSAVRLHTDAAADRLAASVQSVAFTHGDDIYLSGGSYAPHTEHGSRLLAHELAHVAQGRTGGSAGTGTSTAGVAGTIGRADDPAERAADTAAATIAPELRRSLDRTPAGGPRVGAGRDRSAGGTADALPSESTAETSSPPGISRCATRPDTGDRHSPLRRRISATSADIASRRRNKSALGKLTGSNDSLDKIGKLLDRHSSISDQQAQVTSLTAILALVERWLKNHTGDKDRDMAAFLEDVGAEAKRDLGQAKAQQRYVNDLRAGEVSGRAPKLAHETTATPFSQQLTFAMASKVQGTMEQAGQEYGDADPRKEAADLIRSAGLTEAEVAAIKFFTANDFMYINPAVANSSGWMTAQLGTITKIADKLKTGRGKTVDAAQMQAEGSTHAGVMMQGLAKMEAKKGTVYRGARMTPTEFDATYGSKKELTYHSFVSSAVKSGPAWNYADGGGAVPPRADQTVSVKCVFEVDDARDLRALSEVKSEEEWLLLPGATFDITKIEDEANGKPGTPAATAWKIVYLKQKRPKVGAPADSGAAAGGPMMPPLPPIPGPRQMPPLPAPPAGP